MSTVFKVPSFDSSDEENASKNGAFPVENDPVLVEMCDESVHGLLDDATDDMMQVRIDFCDLFWS